MARINSKKSGYFLSPVAIIRYLMDKDDHLDTLISCATPSQNLFTTDQSLYEALVSIPRDKININRLIKLIEVSTIISHKYNFSSARRILSADEADKLFKMSFRRHNQRDNQRAIKSE